MAAYKVRWERSAVFTAEVTACAESEGSKVAQDAGEAEETRKMEDRRQFGERSGSFW